MEDKAKNKSMQSTMYMSNYQQSKASNFFTQKQISTSYSHIPMKKQTPKWNQSSATWRNTSPRYSFSRDDRFRVKIPYYTDLLQPELPSTKSPVSCTFGKGERRPISTVILRNAKEKPSPDRYDIKNIDEEPRSPKKGKSIGEKWDKYQKVYIDHRKDVYSGHFNLDNPPAHYEVRETPGKDKRKFTAYGRLTMFTKQMADLMSNFPGPHHKIKDRHLYGTTGLNQRNFSFSQRIDLTKPANDYPGAKYKIPGFCHKFKSVKKKLGQSDIIN